MKPFRSILFCLCLLMGTTTQFAHAQAIDPIKKQEIEKLLELTGALKLGQQMSSAMTAQLTDVIRASNPNIPKKALDMLPEEVNAVIANNIDQLKTMVIAVYDRNYTLDDIKGLNAFYSSELGRKVSATLPAVLQQSMTAGQQWGESLGPEIGRRIKARFKKEGVSL